MLDNGEYFDNIKTIEYQITHTSAWEGMQQRSVKNKLPVLVLFNPHFSFNVGKKKKLRFIIERYDDNMPWPT